MKSKIDGMNKEALFILGVLKGMKLRLAVKAVYFTVKHHGGRMRDDKVTKYFEHPIRVCRMLLNLGIYDEVILVAALLHDLVEDGHVTMTELREIFGSEVSHLVGLLTKNKGMSSDEYYEMVAKDIRAALIKAVDRVCNVDDMTEVFSLERLEKYIADTRTKVLPIMKDARREYLDYTDVFVLLRDYIKGILRAADRIVAQERQIIALKNEIEILKEKTKKKRKRKRAKKAM